jgi:hypothetical protein
VLRCVFVLLPTVRTTHLGRRDGLERHSGSDGMADVERAALEEEV